MTTAVLGGTGFVGSTLARQIPVDETHDSKSIAQIRGRSFDSIYCACAPGQKWLANKEPEKDAAAIDSIIDHLRTTRVRRFVLISTVDVYPRPINVDETSIIDPAQGHPYGQNRLRLEQVARDIFPSVTVLRLPGLFGLGLRKNVIYDFLTDNQVDRIHSEGVFQFYNMDYLAKDIRQCQEQGIDLLNVATEPVSVRELAQAAFGRDFDNNTGSSPARYDFRTMHSSNWGRSDGYLYGKEDVLKDMGRFVESERGRAS
jgi:nucleoside-diphosphate-sugar epimerase